MFKTQTFITMPKHQITIDWQFDATEEDSQYLNFNNILERPAADTSTEPQSECLVRRVHKISKNHLSGCLRKNGHVDISIIEAYLDILCSHHNAKRPPLKNSLPKYINLGHTFFERLTQRPSLDNPNQGLRWGTERLREIAPSLEKSARRASLLAVEHMLVPVMPRFDPGMHPEFTDLNHVALMIVSPRIKLVEYFDSRHEPGDKYIYLMLEYLTFELGGKFKRNEWSYRQNQGPAQKLAVEHKPAVGMSQPTIKFYGGNDGPIHAAIHAWNCLFGFSLYAANRTRFNVHEDILKKRHRIVVDICANRIILEDRYDFNRNENLVPTVIHNYYLGVTESEWGDWVPSKGFSQLFWSSGHQEPTHRSLFKNITPMQYYTWAALYGRPRCGRTPEEEERNEDGSLKYPLIKGSIQNADQRIGLLVDICRFLEIEGKEENYEETEGWTEKVLMRAVLAHIDEQKDGFYVLWCDTKGDDGERDVERKEDTGSGFWTTLTSKFRTV